MNKVTLCCWFIDCILSVKVQYVIYVIYHILYLLFLLWFQTHHLWIILSFGLELNIKNSKCQNSLLQSIKFSYQKLALLHDCKILYKHYSVVFSFNKVKNKAKTTAIQESQQFSSLWDGQRANVHHKINDLHHSVLSICKIYCMNINVKP